MRNLKYKYKFILFLLLCSGYFPILFSQQLSTELFSRLSASDQKKIQKADELNKKGVQSEEEADKIFEPRKSQLKRLEASEYYQNSATEQSKVLKNNIKSFWKKYSGNKSELESIRKLEDAAWDSLNSAKKIRDQVEKEGKIDQRIALLRKAEKVENNALVRLQKVLYVYINLPVHYDEKWIASESNIIPVTTTAKVESQKNTPKSLDTTAAVKKTNVQANDSSIYGIVKVNEEQIDQFHEFLKKTYPSDVERYVINFSELDYSDINQLKDAWYKYQFGTASGDTNYTLVADNTKDTVSVSSAGTDTHTASLTSSSKINNKVQADNLNTVSDPGNEEKKYVATTVDKDSVEKDMNPSGVKETEQKSGKEISSENNSSLNKEQKSVATNVHVDKKGKTVKAKEVVSKTNTISGKTETSADFIYRVQIAACRIPIDKKVLQDIYNGPEKILELEEELWYKYAIGNFSTYKEAHEFAESSKIPGAFVISYLNGKRIKITPTAVSKNESSSKESVITSGEIEFRVQIATSKSQIPDRLLKNIFNDIKSLKISSENGWYKYSLPAGNTVDKARALIKTLNIPGAFVIAYQNGVKVDLAEAVKLTSN